MQLFSPFDVEVNFIELFKLTQFTERNEYGVWSVEQ